VCVWVCGCGGGGGGDRRITSYIVLVHSQFCAINSLLLFDLLALTRLDVVNVTWFSMAKI